MSEAKKTILERANAAVTHGDNEGFLAFCAEDLVWMAVGGETLNGKEAVRNWMAANYVTPPEFTVTQLISEGDYVVALGDIAASGEDGALKSAYCDVWRFREGQMVELRAFVI